MASGIVVQAKDFTITQEEFLKYKENLKLVHQSNQIPFNVNDEEIINQMIDRELLQHYKKRVIGEIPLIRSSQRFLQPELHSASEND